MKKVLIISYYWPPSAGSGVQRWLKFAKYLQDYNWKPIIYTPSNPYFEINDLRLLDDIPDNIQVWKNHIWEPYRLKDLLFGKENKNQSSGLIMNRKSWKNQFLNWFRGNIFIPDPKVYWVNPSINFLRKRIQEEGINHIITTGPPHSMHLIGLGLKKNFKKLKWIADFRDPWSELDLLDEFHLTSFARNKNRKLEKEVLKNADICVSVSETWVCNLKKLGAKNVALLTNGYDADDFNIKNNNSDKFIIGHYGLLNHLRNPEKLWKILNELCRENSEFNNKLEIHLSGNIDNDIINSISSYNFLKDKLKELGYLSHHDVVNQYNKSSVLVLLLFNSKSGIGNYPGKIFEYFAAKKPILAFGPANSDVEKLINETKSGIYHNYMSEINLKKDIIRIYNKSISFNFSKIEKYSRKKLTGDLVNLLNSM